jgi:hypothetical protein
MGQQGSVRKTSVLGFRRLNMRADTGAGVITLYISSDTARSKKLLKGCKVY